MKIIPLIFIIIFSLQTMAQTGDQPLRLGIAGLTHDHVHGILRRPDKGDIKIVGISEPNKELAMRYLKRYKLNENLWYPSLEELIKATKPEAVAAFNSIYEHLEVVRICAPRNIHVLVEKPLAVSMEHAREMEKLARENNIELLTNYETTWYPSNHMGYEVAVENKALGELRKVVIHDGHKGPKEIGVSKEFLNWLTDPVLNGGGAIIDFGCYGANLMTWLMNGEKPLSVTAITQTMKPDLYPKVDDEATIILEYPKAQAVVQASWNWPISRKDMEIYGETGQIVLENHEKVRLQKSEKEPEEILTATSLDNPFNDPFSYFAAIVRGKIKPKSDLSSLENNLVVVEILDAAVNSAKTGKTVKIK